MNSILGRALVRRGHRVTVFQLRALRLQVEALGLQFFPLDNPEAGSAEWSEVIRQIGSATGIKAMRVTLNGACRLAHLICKAGPGALQAAGVDLLLVDQNEPAGATVAEYLKLPFISVCSGLPLNREPRVPPPFVPWNYRDSLWAEWRNRCAYAVFDRLLAPLTRTLNGYRRKWGMPLIYRPDDTFSHLAQLCPLTPDFDFPRVQKPAGFHYVGPFRDESRSEVQFPYERLNERPLVYASLGTLGNRSPATFQAIAAAVAGLHVQLVMTLGGAPKLDETLLAGSPIVVTYAPQEALLSRAALCITHGGLNTVLESLSAGTPMVVVPITNDQPANAARVRWTGSGELVPLSQIATRRFQSAVRAVLEDPRYRMNARRLQESFARYGGTEAAVDIVERFLPQAKQAAQGRGE